MAGPPTRAVVADDSSFMRTTIRKILEDGGVEVVGTAENGREAVEAVAERDPDVVTMDVEMPVMDGLEAVERITDRHPTPVLMLSAHTVETADVTFEALERGAVDFFTKPRKNATTEIHGVAGDLVAKVESVAGASVPGATGGRTRPTAGPSGDAEYLDDPVLILAASTGGPPVVERVLSEIPGSADLRILVVQHMVDEFTARFAERLDGTSGYDVREATDGARIGGGEALVAKGGYHMRVSGIGGGRLRVRLDTDEPVHGVRPAADVTLRSAAEAVGDAAPITAAVLTGIGRDGSRGVEAIDGVGGRVIAQDEATSVAFGMPGGAIETGCVDSVLPDHRIAGGVLDSIERNGGPR
jgi:two-component system chemotaxis response regulator CheB